jgi:multidrug efflux system outer membrane protein
MRKLALRTVLSPRNGTGITLSALFVLMLVAGCAVGPDYTRPSVAAPQNWRIEYAQAADVANPRWWEQFGDSALDQLIDEALRANLDLVIAAARVDQFIGGLTTTRSQFYPQLGYSADASRNRSSRVGQPPIPAGGDPYYTLYQGALGAQWQIDLFGRVRRQGEERRRRLSPASRVVAG